MSLVKNLCEHLLPWKGFRIKTACCSLEFRGLSGSQRGSSFAERVRTLEMVFRGCRRNTVEKGGKGGQGRERVGKRERKRAHHYYYTFKLSQDINFMEPTITSSSPLLNEHAKLCNSSTTDKSGNGVMHPF